MRDRYSEVPEAKSLRWIANNFPWIDDPKDDIERMNNAIHVSIGFNGCFSFSTIKPIL